MSGTGGSGPTALESLRHRASRLFDNSGDPPSLSPSPAVYAGGSRGYPPREELPLQQSRRIRIGGRVPPPPGYSDGNAAKTRSGDLLARLDPQRKVPRKLLQRAVSYYERNQRSIRNKRYVTIVDYTQHSSKRRMYLVDMKTGGVQTYLVAHGKYSDPNHDGYATRFSNGRGSKQSSVGFYVTGGTHHGKHGRSMYLNGREASNSAAYDRSVVLHGAGYVHPGRGAMGRSWGCPAVEPRYASSIINRLKDGSLLYVYGG